LADRDHGEHSLPATVVEAGIRIALCQSRMAGSLRSRKGHHLLPPRQDSPSSLSEATEVLRHARLLSQRMARDHRGITGRKPTAETETTNQAAGKAGCH